jgi:hypothetical protein
VPAGCYHALLALLCTTPKESTISIKVASFLYRLTDDVAVREITHDTAPDPITPGEDEVWIVQRGNMLRVHVTADVADDDALEEALPALRKKVEAWLRERRHIQSFVGSESERRGRP